MKKILLVSDSHGKLENLRAALRRVKPVDMILHMGDVEGDESEIRAFAGCPVYFVSGNCDGFSREPWEQVIEVEGHRILMTHGHRCSVSYDLTGLVEMAKGVEADIALFGHTHIPEQEETEGILICNPGSISKPRQDGHQPSFAILEFDRTGGRHITINYLPRG